MQDEWLKQTPGDKKGLDGFLSVLGMVCLGILVIIIIQNINGTVSFGILFVFVTAVVLWCVVAMWSWGSKDNQICPKCHHEGRPGYTVCAGCGFSPGKEVPCDSSSSVSSPS